MGFDKDNYGWHYTRIRLIMNPIPEMSVIWKFKSSLLVTFVELCQDLVGEVFFCLSDAGQEHK